MDHVVYVDTKARGLEKLLTGAKTMIVRGATGRKLTTEQIKRWAGKDYIYISTQ